MIIAYSTHHRAYTAYGFPIRNSLVFRQLTGYHSTPQDAVEWARLHPKEMINTTRVHDSVNVTLPPNWRYRDKAHIGTITGRVTIEEKRLTATQAAEARDKFNEAHPGVRDWWDGVKKGIADQTNIPKSRLDFESLYMQQPAPVEDDDAGSRFAAHCEGYDTPQAQRRPEPGVRKNPRGHTASESAARSIPGRKSPRP